MTKPALTAFKIIATGAPWLISMYTLYWLEYDEIWSPDTSHRGKFSVIILIIGMGLSFLVYSRLFKSGNTR